MKASLAQRARECRALIDAQSIALAHKMGMKMPEGEVTWAYSVISRHQPSFEQERRRATATGRSLGVSGQTSLLGR